ncbi:MAG: slipin family protein [Alphaproteobacteria bacterium]|nr:slipin family protein [Alphaproteobacteria bacterium]
MNELDTLILAVGVAALLLAFAVLATRKKVTIYDWQFALLYNGGVYKRSLAPGTHRFFAPPHSWIIFDRRPQFITLPGQEVLTRDALGVKVTLLAEIQIEDPAKLVRAFPVSNQGDLVNAIYPLLQVPIREAASTYTLDEIIQNRDALPELVRAAAIERLNASGLKLVKISVRDIMISKELREAYAASAIAQKTAAATLERARGEVAAMRALSNAARMAQGNPELMQLRALQAMQNSNSGRHTVVFDFAGKTAASAAQTVTDADIGSDEDLL